MKRSAFETKVKNNKGPFVAEFWAPWCGPCKMMAPHLAKAENEYKGKVELPKINADESAELLSALGIRGIPTMIGYNHGREVARITGAMTLANVMAFFASTQESKAFSRHLSLVERLLRIIPALFFFYLGAVSGPAYWMLAVGVVFLFLSVYDRCPLYKAISGQIKNWAKREGSS